MTDKLGSVRRTTIIKLRLILFIAVCVPVVPSSGDVISFQEGVDGYMGTIDKSILAAGSDGGNGEDPSFGVDGSPQVHALIRFEDIFGNSSGQIPLNNVAVNNATLSLFVTNASPSVSVYQMLVDWDETATWAGTFGGDGITLGVDASSTPLDTLAPFGTGTQTFDVTGAVAAWLSGSQNFGFGLIANSSDGAAFNSSENTTIANRPILSIDFTTVPEPGSATVLALVMGMAALLRYRRAMIPR